MRKKNRTLFALTSQVHGFAFGTQMRAISTYSIAISMLALPLQAATYIQFDLTSYLNYDAVGTQNEVTAVNVQTPVDGTADTVDQQLGGHNIANRTAYTDQASVPGGQTGLPADGVLLSGKYQISTAYDNGTDFLTSSSNVVQILANNTNTTQTQVFTLGLAQQAQYSSFNLAFTVQRASSASTYSSQIKVNYTDTTSTVVMLTNDGAGDVPRGTFGSNQFALSADSYTFTNEAPGTGETVSMSNVHTSTYFLGLSGSGTSQVSSIRSGDHGIFEFANDISLDPTKTLQSIEIQLTRGGVNRDNALYVWGISGVLVPEPGVIGLLASGSLLILLRRRKR